MKTEIEVHLTPDELAEVFINWGNDEQAYFINLIGMHFKEAKFDAEMQCLHIVKLIYKPGRDFIYTLANFLKVRGIPCGAPKENTLINSYNGDSLR